MLHLGIDVGTQGTKCIVLDAESNRIVGKGSSNYGILPSTIEGRAEQQPSTWITVMTYIGDISQRAFSHSHSPTGLPHIM